MQKSLIALVGATGIGLAALAAPAPANAGCYGCAVGAGILGGVAAGAIIGSVIANRHQSLRYNLLKSWSQSTEISTRIKPAELKLPFLSERHQSLSLLPGGECSQSA